MKVLYLVSGIGPPAGWGTEFIQELIFGLSQKGVKSTIINPIYKHTHPNWKNWTNEVGKKYGVRVISLEAPGWIKERLLVHFALTPLLVTIAALKLLKKERFDLVHEFSSTPVILFRALLLKVLFATPTVFTLSVYNNTILGKFYWFRIFDTARYYCIPSREVIKSLVKLSIKPEKIQFVPPGVELEKFRRLPPKDLAKTNLHLPNKKFIISYFGSLTKEKGIGDLIEATKAIPKDLQNKVLVALFAIWKGSTQHKYFRDKILQLKLQNLKLFEKHIDIPTLLSASDAIILPHQTGHGATIPQISVIETLAANKPLITTNILGNRELFKKNNSLAVPRDPSSLARKIEDAYNKKPKQKTTINLSIFNLSRTVLVYYKIYQNLSANT